jgi:excisionase family DNA binding protein
MDASNDLLTVKEVSVYLRKSPSTVYRLTREGKLPGIKVGGTWRYSQKSLEKWIEAGFLKVSREQLRDGVTDNS